MSALAELLDQNPQPNTQKHQKKKKRQKSTVRRGRDCSIESMK